MKDQLINMLKRPPNPGAIQTVRQAQEFKKFHASASKQMAKKLTDTQLSSLYSEAIKWY